jgi:hypothetical protein
MLNNLRNVSKKLFTGNLTKFNFSTQAQNLPTLEGRPIDVKSGASEKGIQPWVEVENRLSKLRGELVLADHGKIEEYVLGVFKGYFRTTFRNGLSVESEISEHGLDSLDAIEIGMILEDE